MMDKQPDFGTMFNDLTTKVATENIKKSAVSKEQILDALTMAAKLSDREKTVYVVAAEWIPDDCYGILYVRKEVAERFRKRSEGDDRC